MSFAPVEPLATERLQLMPLEFCDVDRLLELDADPEVMRYLTGGRPSTRNEVEAVVRRSIGCRWVALRGDDGSFVGWIGLHPRDAQGAPGEAELGYRLRRSVWGQGLASEGCRAVIAYGFDRWALRRITAQTMTVNTASRRVMEACGMRYLRTFHLEWPEVIEGSEQGDVEYELLPGWPRTSPTTA